MKCLPILLTGAIVVVLLSSCGGRPVDGNSSHSPPGTDLPPKPELLNKPPELNAPAGPTVSQGALDFVNELGPDRSQSGQYIFRAKTSAPLWMRGWAYDDTHQTTPGIVWIQLTRSGSTQTFYLPANRMERPDVALGFKLPWARQAGFLTPVITDHNIPRGTYQISVYQLENSTPELTKWYPFPVMLIVE
jgi:hypothetical protein